MKSTFTWTLLDGREAKIEAEYVCKLIDKTVDADGWIITVGKETSEYGSDMVLYVDGAKVDSCPSPSFWRLVDSTSKTGVKIKKIWGLTTGFTEDSGLAPKYEAWLNALIDGGTTDEVKAYKAEQRRKEKEEELKRAKELIAKAEKQKTIPPKAEANRLMRQYNDIMNEGGEGFVPHIISREEYDYALKVVADSEKEFEK